MKKLLLIIAFGMVGCNRSNDELIYEARKNGALCYKLTLLQNYQNINIEHLPKIDSVFYLKYGIDITK